MKTFQLLKYIVLIGLSIQAESALVTEPADVYSCAGQNVTLEWQYDNIADFLGVSWTFSNATVTDVTILQRFGAGSPMRPSSSPFIVEFIDNGVIKLFDTSAMFTGTYGIGVEYGIESTATDAVAITIYDVPQNLTVQKVNSTTFTCLGSSSIPTVFRVTVNNVVSQETSPYTSRGNNELIECCYNGTAANCSTEEFDNVYGTLFCKLVQKPGTQTTTSVPTTTESTSSTSTSTSTSTQSTNELVTDTQPISTTQPHNPVPTTVSDNQSDPIVVPLAVGLSLGGTVILVVVIVAVVCCMRRQRNELKGNTSASVSTSANHMRSGTEQYRVTNRRPKTAGPLGRATPDQRDRRQYIPSTNVYHEPEFTYAHGRQHGNRSSGDKGNVRQASEDHSKPHARRHIGSEAGVRRNPMYIEEMRPASVDRGAVDVLHHNYIGNSDRYTPQFNRAYNYY